MNREFLANIPLFSRLTPEQLEAIRARLQHQTYEKGGVIFHRHAPSDAMYIIEEGWVSLRGEREAAMADLGPGSVLGAMGFFSGQARTISARASTPVRVALLDAQAAQELISADADLGLRLGLAMGLCPAQLQPYVIARLQQATLFSALKQEEQQALVAKLAPIEVEAEQTLFRRGDEAHGIFFVETGRIQLTSGEGGSRQAGPGESFGEMTLMARRRHTHTAHAVEASELWHLTPEAFEEAAQALPDLRFALTDLLSRTTYGYAETHLRKLALAGDLSGEHLERISQYLRLRECRQGDMICREGATGSEMFFIESGAIRLVGRGQGGDVHLGSLSEGDFFGENALLSGRGYSFSARAVTDARVWVLDQVNFEALLSEFPKLGLAFSRIVSERLNETLERMRTVPGRPPLPPEAKRPLAPPGAAERGMHHQARTLPQARRVAPPGAPISRRPAKTESTLAARLTQAWARLSQRTDGLALWFASRNLRVKVTICVLLLLGIWLCFIVPSTTLINALAADMDGPPADALPLSAIQSETDSMLADVAAALPFVETPTPLPTPTSLPTDTPTPPPTVTATVMPSPTPAATATDTPEPEPTATATEEPTLPPPTAEAAVAIAAVPPTDTPEPEPTATPVPDVDFVITTQRQLTACENEGNHHIYIRVIDKAGNGLDGIPVRVSWGPGPNDSVVATTETKDNGPGWLYFAMFKGTYNVTIDGARSQTASGITPDIPQDELCAATGNPVANSLFHYSYEVIFQRTY